MDGGERMRPGRRERKEERGERREQREGAMVGTERWATEAATGERRTGLPPANQQARLGPNAQNNAGRRQAPSRAPPLCPSSSPSSSAWGINGGNRWWLRVLGCVASRCPVLEKDGYAGMLKKKKDCEGSRGRPAVLNKWHSSCADTRRHQ